MKELKRRVELVSFYTKNSVRFKSAEVIGKMLESCVGRKPLEDTQHHRTHAIGKRLSRDEIDDLVAMYKAGRTSRQLAVEYGITRHSVCNVLRAEGLVLQEVWQLTADQQREVVRLYIAEQLSVAKVAARLGLAPSRVQRILAKEEVELRGRHDRPDRPVLRENAPGRTLGWRCSGAAHRWRQTPRGPAAAPDKSRPVPPMQAGGHELGRLSPARLPGSPY